MRHFSKSVRWLAVMAAVQGMAQPVHAADSWFDRAVNALMDARSGRTPKTAPVPATGAVDEWGATDSAARENGRYRDERDRDERYGTSRRASTRAAVPERASNETAKSGAATGSGAARRSSSTAAGGRNAPGGNQGSTASGCLNVRLVWSGAAALAARGEEGRAYDAYLRLFSSCTKDSELVGTAYEAQRNLSQESLLRLMEEPVLAAPELQKVLFTLKVTQMFAANKAHRDTEALSIARSMRQALLASDNAGGLEVAGWLEQRAKSYRAAETLFRAALKIDRDATGSRQGLVYSLIGQRKLILAEREASRLDGDDADQVRADVLVAEAAQAQAENDPKRALELLKKAEGLGADPEGPALETMAWAYKQTGQNDKAAQLFQALLQDQPQRTDLRQGLTDSLAASKDPDSLKTMVNDRNVAVAIAARTALAAKYANAGRRDEAAAVEGKQAEGYGGLVSAQAGFRLKTGDTGEGHLRETILPVLKGRLRLNEDWSAELEGERLTLDDGEHLNHGGEVRARLLTRVDSLSIMAGLGFSQTNQTQRPTFEGSVRMATSDGYVEAGTRREPVRDSVRSYSGVNVETTDSSGNVTGYQRTGRVMDTQVYFAGLNNVDPTENYNLSWRFAAGSMSGSNVYNNGYFQIDAAVMKSYESAKYSWLDMGPWVHLGAFEEDNNRFTSNYGGYFSPRSDLGGGLQAHAMTLEGNRSLYRVNARAGYVTRGQYYGNDSGASLEGSFDFGWLLMPHLLLNSSLTVRNSPGYADVGIRFGLSIPFEARHGMFATDFDFQQTR